MNTLIPHVNSSLTYVFRSSSLTVFVIELYHLTMYGSQHLPYQIKNIWCPQISIQIFFCKEKFQKLKNIQRERWKDSPWIFIRRWCKLLVFLSLLQRVSDQWLDSCHVYLGGKIWEAKIKGGAYSRDHRKLWETGTRGWNVIIHDRLWFVGKKTSITAWFSRDRAVG